MKPAPCLHSWDDIFSSHVQDFNVGSKTLRGRKIVPSGSKKARSPLTLPGPPRMSSWPRTALQHCFKCEASGIKLGYNCRVPTTTSYCHRELGSSSDIARTAWALDLVSHTIRF